MIRFDLPMAPALSISFSHSTSDRLPVRRCWESTLDSMEKRRFTSSANIKHYANIVAEKATLRRLIRINEEIANT